MAYTDRIGDKLPAEGARMPDGLYQRDALAWAEHQAVLLRRLASGERLNEAIDWPNVIEEIQDVGLSELRAVMSLLQRAMTHLLKLQAWPSSTAAAHWHDEAGTFLDDAQRRFTPSMRHHIDLIDLYAKALRRACTASDTSGAAQTMPDDCPFDLDALLAGDIAALVQPLARA
jgi:hypothetical protein